MRLAQEALNRARVQLKEKQPAYTPAAVHAKPSMAVSSAVCDDAQDAAGGSLGFAPLRRAPYVSVKHVCKIVRVDGVRVAVCVWRIVGVKIKNLKPLNALPSFFS